MLNKGTFLKMRFSVVSLKHIERDEALERKKASNCIDDITSKINR